MSSTEISKHDENYIPIGITSLDHVALASDSSQTCEAQIAPSPTQPVATDSQASGLSWLGISQARNACKRKLSDASDLSLLYDGHYRTSAFSFCGKHKGAEEHRSVPDEEPAESGRTYDADDEWEEDCNLELSPALFKYQFTDKILPKMMFVSGETAEASVETTTLIEDITREQVLEIVRSLHSTITA